MSSRLIRMGLPPAIIVAGIVAAVVLRAAAPKPAAPRPTQSVPVVQVTELRATSAIATVRATGVVAPAKEITLIPEVTGRLVFVSGALVPGGRVQQGDVLARVDPRDYELAVEQQRGVVRSAELELELEGARRDIAREEWELLGEGRAASPLALRESQLAAAEANLASNRSALERAQLNLERTTLRAPFNATVVSENVDVGQVVNPQTQMARLVGTDEVWVTVSVPVQELALIEIPGVTATVGSPVVVRQRLGPADVVERTGQILNLVQELDPQSRRAQLLVTVQDPFSTEYAIPLLPGAYVSVEISGREAGAVFVVPRVAVYDGNTVWLVDDESTLRRRTVTVRWGTPSDVYIDSGLQDGERLALPPLNNPIEGLRVEVVTGSGTGER